MRTRLQSRLTFDFLAVLLVGMGLAGALAWRTVEGLYLLTQRDNLLAQARLTAAALQGAPLPEAPVEPYTQTANVAPGIHSRVLGEQGAVVIGLPLSGDAAPVRVPAAENAGLVGSDELLARPEIQRALQGEAATAIRRVAAAGNRRVLYAAAPIQTEAGGLAGIAYLAMPLPPSSLPAGSVLQLAGAVLAAAVLAGATGALLARRIARPLARLARAAESVRAGDLTASVPAESDLAEVRSLGESFNAMTDSLRRSDQAKNAFLADVTHELRTPLTVIKGTIETLQDGALDDRLGREPLLASMERETERLIRLVGGLLVLTRADAGALHLKLQPLDLAGLARQRLAVWEALAAPKGIELRLESGTGASSGAFLVDGDADRLAQVLDNLLDNAHRHAPQGSTITLELLAERAEVCCSVRDQGPGIPPEHLPFIFERFYRVDGARDRTTGGAGLGLAIVRVLVEAHGGQIRAESEPGNGARFTFCLPAARRMPGS